LFPNPDGLLRPGQYGRVRIGRAGEGRDSIAIPEKALILVQNSYSVAVLGPGDKVQMRRVQVGASTAGQRVIESGLEAGERIVVEGMQKVTDGASVRPEPARDDAGVAAQPAASSPTQPANPTAAAQKP
jgi:hypothetical protein